MRLLLVATLTAVFALPICAPPVLASQASSLRSIEITDVSAARKKPKKQARKEQYMRAVPAK